MNNVESEVKSVKKTIKNNIVLCKFLDISKSLIHESSGFNLEKISVLNERNLTAPLPSVEYTDLVLSDVVRHAKPE